MSDEQIIDRNDPELKYLTVEKNQFNDPATQAEWTQKRLVWVPHESQVRLIIIHTFTCVNTWIAIWHRNGTRYTHEFRYLMMATNFRLNFDSVSDEEFYIFGVRTAKNANVLYQYLNSQNKEQREAMNVRAVY